MIVQLCLLMVFCTGSVLCCAYFDKKFEEVLPLTLTGMVLVLFGTSLIGQMLLGVYLVLFLSAVGCLCAGVHLVRTRDVRAFAVRFFTPSFFLFSGLLVLLTYFNSGKVATSWDEFSHWADVVKMMTIENVLSTSALSNSLFQSYPPGMSLFQYFVQKVYLLANPAETFNEWRVYFAYQVFSMAFFFPLCKHFGFKRPLSIAISGIAVLFGALLFFPELLISVYVDVFLALLTGVGFATIYLTPKKDLVCYLNVLACIIMLVLAKDSGLLFAAFLAIALLADGIGFGAFSFVQSLRQKIMAAVAAILAVALPKVLWSLNVTLSGAEVRFSDPIEYDVLWQILNGNGEYYQRKSLEGFIEGFFQQGITLAPLGLTVPYVAMLTLFVVLSVAFWWYAKRVRKEADTRRLVLVPALLFLQTVVFMVGTCVSYLFKFNPTEALELASYERYMATAYLPLCLVSLLALLQLLWQEKGRVKYLALACLLVFSLSSVQKDVLIPFVTRSQILSSIAMREPYLEIEAKIKAIPQIEDGDIYFISQEDTGIHALVIRYCIRPFQSFEIASIKEKTNDEGELAPSITAQALQSLLQESYDYVVIYELDDYFIENYTSLFVDAAEMQENSIYAVDPQTGLLSLCA